jgi:hypothetical protein
MAIKTVHVEGNNGGSFVHIETSNRPGCCWIEIGHDCVMRVPLREIEVTQLAEIIADGINP